jgi:hypothetical protein
MINHNNGYPVIVVVAGFAKIAGIHMVLGFSRGVSAVMAGETRPAVDIGVIKGAGVPTASIMAGIALHSGLYVGWSLAHSDNIVMAAGTPANDFIVIHSNNRDPRTGHMASFAQIGAADMVGILALGTQTIVAAMALIGDGGMIHRRRGYKTIRGVTNIAGQVVYGYMTWRYAWSD